MSSNVGESACELRDSQWVYSRLTRMDPVSAPVVYTQKARSVNGSLQMHRTGARRLLRKGAVWYPGQQMIRVENESPWLPASYCRLSLAIESVEGVFAL